MRIGLFGGTFDPPHVGHLMVAQIAREMAQLDRVVFIPAAIPPHKQHQDITDVESRLAMVAMAVKPFSSFEVSPIECQREGPSYTVDTVLAYRKLYPFAELFLILGADMFENFPTWKDAQEIAKEVTLLVAPRPYQDVDQAISKGQMTLSASQIIFLEMPALDISSSWLRERLVAGLRVDPLLPDGVWNWIVQQGGVSAIVNDWYSLVKSRLTPKRFKHVEGVVYTAKLLAKQFGVDENQAMIAAWLHDIYRELDVETLTRLALEVDVTVPTTAPVTWHGPIAAKRLPLDFAVFDQEIQDAIASHTLGHPQMSAVAQVLYVADAIEPGRSYAGVDELRLAAQKSLPYAVACVADSAILFLVKQHLPICWETVEMRNQLWLGIDETN